MSEIFNIYSTRKPEMQSPSLMTAKDLSLHMADESDNDFNAWIFHVKQNL